MSIARQIAREQAETDKWVNEACVLLDYLLLNLPEDAPEIIKRRATALIEQCRWNNGSAGFRIKHKEEG